MRKKLLSFIKEYIQIHGYAPSVQEMADGVKLKSKSTVHPEGLRKEQEERR